MAEYIEREAVMQEFADRVRRSNNSDFAPAPTWNQAVQIVEDFPSADVVPVRHGWWIATYGDSWKCSVCGAESYVDEDWRGKDDKAYQMNYCHYCGALMDGGGE